MLCMLYSQCRFHMCSMQRQNALGSTFVRYFFLSYISALVAVGEELLVLS